MSLDHQNDVFIDTWVDVSAGGVNPWQCHYLRVFSTATPPKVKTAFDSPFFQYLFADFWRQFNFVFLSFKLPEWGGRDFWAMPERKFVFPYLSTLAKSSAILTPQYVWSYLSCHAYNHTYM